MGKTLEYLLLLIVLIVGAFYLYTKSVHTDQFGNGGLEPGYKDSTYVIEGQPVTLVNGIFQSQAAPGSASQITTKYFGNNAFGKLNGDEVLDTAFLLTQDAGGSGIFYYIVAAIQTDAGYEGTNGLFLGDRIAPQTVEIRNGEIVVNYADRAKGDSFDVKPSVGVSRYFKLDGTNLVETTKQ
jgi:hypothetical protein